MLCNANILLGIALATDLRKRGLTITHTKAVVMFIVPKRSLVSPTISSYCCTTCYTASVYRTTPYGTGQVRDSARHADGTNKQTNTELKLCGPWLAPDITEVTSIA